MEMLERPGALSIKNVTKVYDPEGVNVKAVDNCSMEIEGGEVCMIVGPRLWKDNSAECHSGVPFDH